MNKMFNIYAQLTEEIQDFDQNKVKIASVDGKNGFDFSQKDTLNTVELYWNSKFETGTRDAEGQRKVFLNIVRFRQEIAEKQTDIDVKDFLFIPEVDTDEYGAMFLTKKFREWAKKADYGKIINELNHDYSKFGTCVGKLVGNKIERVPLLTLRNQQDAKSLQTASYVIIEHKDMTLDQIEAYKDWEVTGLNIGWNDKITVYERYGRVPLDWFKKQKGYAIESGDEKKSIDTISILSLDAKRDKQEESKGNLLFIEQITDRPFRECHWIRVDGRWLGIGEVEKNFENQVFRNMVTNMRKRGLLWSSKKIFQSADTELSQNLIKDVKDGQVLKILPNGQISQVNMTTQGLQEFELAAKEIDDNADKTSFTFEVASGEALPSGTPFRLGVMLSQAVANYYSLKRENFGMMMEDIVYDLLLPLFKKENKKEHYLAFKADEEGIQKLKEDIKKVHIYKNAMEQLLNGEMPNIAKITNVVEEKMSGRDTEWIKVPDSYYDDLAVTTTLVTTGENVNVEKRIETLTNLYTTLAQKGDPRADKILTKIMALTGESLDSQSAMQTPNVMQEVQQGAAGMNLPKQASELEVNPQSQV